MSYILDFSFLLPLFFTFALIGKFKRFGLLIALITYFTSFFLLNFLFDEITPYLGERRYYFIYTLSEYLTFTYIFFYYLPYKRARNSIYLLSILFIAFIIFFIYYANIRRVDSFPIGVESILLLIYIVLYFYYSLKKVSNETILEKPSFWFVLGILLYIAFTFFFNILAGSIDPEIGRKYYHYSYFGDIFKNLFFTIGIFYLSKESKESNLKKLKNEPFLDF